MKGNEAIHWFKVLQVEIHNTFSTLYLSPTRRIDSEKNKKASNIIVQVVGTAKYTRRQIQGTYSMLSF